MQAPTEMKPTTVAAAMMVLLVLCFSFGPVMSVVDGEGDVLVVDDMVWAVDLSHSAG